MENGQTWAPCHTWFPDTVVAHHVTPDLSFLNYADDYTSSDALYAGNGKKIPISQTGPY